MSKPPVFEIVFACGLSDLIGDKSVVMSKEFVFSLINDFEDKKWRFEKFSSFIWDSIIETALSKREKDALIDGHYSALKSAAINLRLTDSEKDSGKGSEIAEILLYGVLKHYFNAIPAVPKIFYKQNTHDFAKGADGVQNPANLNTKSIFI
ncbi:hypothetical protein AGMMS50293_31180 [Spirochaetia bacterium]|nr:hypothetical protein AGMMS50293_31180 [Spirochaetia bacterium]